MEQDQYWCPVCGYPDLEENPYRNMPLPAWTHHGNPPYERVYGQPSYAVCDCCGFEFGNDDNPGTAAPVTFEEYRTEWISDGTQWLNPEKRTTDWDLARQLSAIGITLPNLERQSPLDF